jgi:hypothetical protein
MAEDVAPPEVGPSDAGTFDIRLRFSLPSPLLAIHDRWFYYLVPPTNDCIIALFSVFCFLFAANDSMVTSL